MIITKTGENPLGVSAGFRLVAALSAMTGLLTAAGRR